MKARISEILTGMLLLFAVGAQAENSGTMRGPVRSSLDVANPYVQNWVQTSGSVEMNITNRGFYGNAGPQQADLMVEHCYGNWAPQCEFPAGSGQQYLFQAGLWIGAEIVDESGTTPRVSVAIDGWLNPQINEWFPGEGSVNGPVLQSDLPDAVDYCDGHSIYNPDARANFESISVYTDTLTDPFWVRDDPVDGDHAALNLEITQSVLTWDSPDFSNLLIFEYVVRNIGDAVLENLCLGFYSDVDCGPGMQLEHHTDDITGFLRTDPVTGDVLNIGWAADNDGRPPHASSGEFDNPHSMGVMALSDVSSVRTGYNWWVSNGSSDLDYGPSWHSHSLDSMAWTTTYGTPIGDLRKYQLLRGGELDFDQIYVNDPDWIAANPQTSYDPVCGEAVNEPWSSHDPSPQADDVANGFDTRFLMSWGPLGIFDHTDPEGCDVYQLNPGEEFTFTLGFLLGPDFHDPDHPQPNNTDIDPTLFDFTGLIESARAAQYLHEHNYEGIVAPPEAFAPSAAGDGTMPLAWSTPSSGTADHYEIWGIYAESPEDTMPMTAGPINGNAFTLQGFQNGEEWRMLIRTIDEEMYRSAFTDTLVRVGAVLPVTDLAAQLVGPNVFISWNGSNDPALDRYTIARKSIEGDSVTFTSYTNAFFDSTVVNGRYYDYWVITESDYGVTGVPSLPVHALPFTPQEAILVIEESYELEPIDFLQCGIEPDSIHNAYVDILAATGYSYDFISQPRNDELVFGLEDLAAHDIVIWNAESNQGFSTLNRVAERERIFNDYVNAGGHMIRAGKRLLNSGLNINAGSNVYSDYLQPLEFDSVRAVSNHAGLEIKCSGLTSLDERYPDIDLNPERIVQQRWGGDYLDYLHGIELLWPGASSCWPLYSVEVQEEDTSGYEGQPCAVISENIVFLDFSLYFIERAAAVQILQASIEGLRDEAFDVPESPKTAIPSEIVLHQNYPNPFNPTTTISFSIPATDHVVLKIYDIMGREVTTLLNQRMSQGTYNIDFNGGNFASGLYFYRLHAGSEMQTRKMILLK